MLVGLLAIAAATGLRVWLLQRTWFYLDDLVLTNAAAAAPLTAHQLVEPYYGHLMPGGRLLAWLVSASGPYEYAVAIAQVGVLYALCGLAMLHLLLTLFGRRPAILVPLTYFLVSPFLIPATAWWAAGINHLPSLAATCLCLAAHVRYLRDGRARDLVASSAWLVAGLVFAELTLFVVVPLVVITLGYFASGTIGQRIGHVWAHHRGSVVALGAIGAAYVGIYFSTAWETIPSPTPPDWSAFITNASLTALPAAAIGGPGGWHVAWAAQLEVAPSALTRLIGYVVAGTVLSLSAIARDRGLRAWLIPAGQLALGIILLGRSRSLFGPGIALDLRFFVPVGLGMALALGLAFLPVERAVESSSVRTAGTLVDRPWVVLIALGTFTAFSITSARSYPLLHLGDRSPEPFLTGATRTLQQQGSPVTLVDATVPEWVLGPPVNDYGQALAPLRGHFRLPTVVQDDYYVLDDQGRLVRADLDPARNAQGPPPAACGYPVRSDRAVPLDGPVLGFGWRLRVAYTADADTGATITIGDVATDAHLLAGRHVLELPGDAAYDAVRISGVDPKSRLCVSSLTVGTTKIPE
ncbi:MAG TPA: hypothetical protein VFV89_21020 [Nocardioides sp.]|uniref:hypothetical protein n=1 Tax=Nocardioides sp. TaxID=35761 RepID=UPI002E32A0C0|nr:hypothetical protein [Nocardioides sp.]HEX5090304.1 hypothetical protein [Nocardioides sp.]